jgi:hypothetical protein
MGNHEIHFPLAAEAQPAAELPGMQPTMGYINFSNYPVERIAEILKQKLSS